MAKSIHLPYKAADGKRVPGVTTIIGRFKESGGLIHWAWEQGLAGIDYRETRDTAAGIGTLAHDAVESFIKSEAMDWMKDPQLTREDIERGREAYRNFTEWASQSQLQVTHSELPLVCEHLRYGGRFDAVFIHNKRSLGDWKTSGGVYAEYLIQIAAYGHLWDDHFPDDPITGGFHLLRFSKDQGDFSHHHWDNLDMAWRAFVLMRELYDLMPQLKKRIA